MHPSSEGVALPVIRNEERARRIIELVHYGQMMEIAQLPHQGAECEQEWADPDPPSDIDGTEEEERLQMKQAFHHGTHFGRDKTMKFCQSRWRFPTTMCLKSTVMTVLERCQTCQRTRGKMLTKTGAVMHPVSRPDRPCVKWGVDLIGKISPEVDGKSFIITCVDYHSKYLVSGALKDKTASSVALFIYNNIICRFGVPTIILTDQGSEFNNHVFRSMTNMVAIKHCKTSAYNPRANGLAESTNKMIQTQLRRLCANDRRKWVALLPTVVFNYNSSVHSSTGYTPHKMLHAFEPVTPIENIIEAQERGDLDPEMMEYDPNTVNIMEKITDYIWDDAKKNNAKATEKQCRQFGKRFGSDDGGHLYQVGDRVWKWNAKDAARKAKNVDKWTGPYRVVKLSGTNGYILKRDGHVNTKTVPQAQLQV